MEERLAPATLHWIGNAAANGNLWSVASNWLEGQAPASGDRLIFDTTTAGFSATANGFGPTNDLTGLTNLTIGINDASAGGDFVITGNAIGLTTTAGTGIDSTLSVGTVATINNDITLGANTTIAVGLGALTLGGVISGSFSLTAAGSPSSTLTLNGVNTFTGGATLTSGTVSVDTDTSLGTGTITFNGGTLSDATSFLKLPNIFAVNAPSTIGGGGFFELDGDGTLNSTLSLANTGFLTLDGALDGSGGLSEIGFPGSTTLGGTTPNTFTGGTSIVFGGITLDKTPGVNAVASPVTVVGSFASLGLSASNQINDSASVYLGQGASFSTAWYTDTVAGLSGLGSVGLTFGSAGITVMGSGNQLFTGSVGGSGQLTYDGTGSLTLGGASAGFSGTLTAESGVLNVSGNFSSATVVVSGGTLDGTGVVKSITANNGTVDPAPGGTPGVLNIASSTAASTFNGATLQVELGGPGPSDELALGANATLNLANANLIVNGLGGSYQDSYQIITSPTGGITGVFNSLPNGSAIAVGGQSYQINYTTSAVTLTNVNAASQTLHWTGASGSNWSNPANWAENVVPIDGDTLVFDTGTPGFAATAAAFAPLNDINALTNMAIVINDDSAAGDFAIGGNAFSLISTAGTGISSTVASGAAATISNAVTLAANTTINVGLGTLTLTGAIGGNFALTEAGSPSGTLDLNADNTYSGGTVLAAGTVSVATNTSLGSGTLTLNGGTLANGAAFLHVANPYVVSSLSTIGGGSFFNLDGNGTLNANLRLTNSGFLTLSGALSGSGGLIEDGFPGSTTLSGAGANTFTGATTIIGGSISMDKAIGVTAIVSPISLGGGSFPSLGWGASDQLGPAVTIAVGADSSISINNANDSVVSLTGIGSLAVNTSSATGLTVTGTGNILYTGSVGGDGMLTYDGSGSFTLGGNSSSFSGQLIAEGGTLAVSANFSGAEAITDPAGTLTGTGLVKTLSTVNSGTFNPAGSGVGGILSTATGNTNASALAGATFRVDITDIGLSDQLVIGDNATISLSSATLSVNVLHSTAGSVYTLISSATGGISGTFVGLPNNTTFTTSGNEFQIHYTPDAVTLTCLQVLALSPASLPGGEVGLSYDQTITTTGGAPPITLAVTHVTNTTGLTISGNGTGTITIAGTPSAAGTVTFTVTATDASGQGTPTVYTFTVYPPVVLAPANLPTGEVGYAYSQTITPTGGLAPVTLAVSNVTNSTGIRITGSGTGAISLAGTPSAAGTVSFTVTPTDGIGAGAGKVYSFVVYPALGLTPTGLPPGEAAIAYSQIITASGGAAPVSLVLSSVTNTTGLNISGSGTGVITLSGTPTSAGTVTFTVTPSDAFGSGAAKIYSFIVSPAVVLGPAALPGAIVGTAYTQSISSTGGSGSVQLTVSAVTNTTGLTIAGSGTGSISISGTPTSTGTVTFTVTPSDLVGTAPSQVYSFAVQQATSFSNLSSATISYGTATTQFTGQLVPSPNTPLVPAGETVQVTLDGVTQNATLDGSDGFTATFATAALGVTGSPYAVGFAYAGDANFLATTGTSTLTVTQAAPVITWTNPAAISYGTPLGAAQLAASANTAGTFTYTLADNTTPAAGAILQVGLNQVLNVSFKPTDASDFTSATAQVAINVIPKALTAEIVGDPTKNYDGGTAAVLTSANFQLVGLVGSDSFTITQPAGVYNSKDANATSITASLEPSNFTIGAGTIAGDYTLPSLATGPGSILPLTLTAAIVGDPTKIYDGTTAAALTSANFKFTGLLTGESMSVTQTAGTYDTADITAASVTAALSAGNFAPGAGTLAIDYALPTSATGPGAILAKTLTAAIVGDPTKPYDGTTTATLTPANFQLTGLPAGQSVSVTQTAGLYDSKDINAATVTTNLLPSNFSAGPGTLLSDFTLPTAASGHGTIVAQILTASIVGTPTKVYDSTTSATLTAGNFQLNGLVGSESFSIAQTVGTYNSPDTNAATVSASLSASQFTAGAGTLASDYKLPNVATGPGAILARTVTTAIVGTPSKTYDGTSSATLAPANFQLTNLVAGQSFTVTQTVGAYDSADTNAATVSVSLSAGNYSAGAGTLASDYILPTSASGPGTILAKTLTASILGNPTKTYDGSTAVALTSANFGLTGLVGANSFTITQTAGNYNSKDTSAATVSASLSPSEFVAGAGTVPGDYALPSVATGPGAILAKALTAAIVGDPTKAYDGTTKATLTPANFQLTGLIAGESLIVTQTAGTYDNQHINAATVTTSLSASNFTAGPNSLVSDYALPTSASGAGAIVPKTLVALIIGDPTKTYDGTDSATLTAGYFQLVGLALGENFIITQTAGTYNTAHASATTISAALPTGDLTAAPGTQTSDYVLPTSASGPGTIQPKTLTAAIVGDPTKPYDGTTAATLTPANYALTGLIGGDSFTVTQSAGVYNSKDTNATAVSAALAPSQFVPIGGTQVGDYALPTSAGGQGTIVPKMLTAVIVGNPSKTYDGTLTASLASANIQLDGLAPGDGFTVAPTAGLYNVKDTTANTVTAALFPNEFSPTAGTPAYDYSLPSVASGPGTILPVMLKAALVGNPTKTYDGTTTATLTPANFQLAGVLAGESLGVNQTVGTYNVAEVTATTVTAALSAGNLTAGPGTLAADYALPTSATGAGTIFAAPLTAAIVGAPSKIYDGGVSATLTPANFELIGLAPGQSLIVTQTAGVYDSLDTDAATVTASLPTGDFSAGPGTLISDYQLPTAASGPGAILPKPLTASIVGDPTKPYDGTTSAILTPANFQLTGVVFGDGFTVTQTTGAYDSADTNAAKVTAGLSADDFSAGAGTLAADYVLPTAASGPGAIVPASQSIVFNVPNAVSLGSPPITLSATGGGSGNPVTFSLISGPGSLSGNHLSINGAGTVVVEADQAGSLDYTPAPSVQQSIQVTIATSTGSENENGTPTVLTVANILGSHVSSFAVSSNSKPGIAVFQAAGNGSWQYSTTGTTWTPIAGVSQSQALLLPGNYSVRFVPAANWSGQANLYFVAWDGTQGTAGGSANIANGGGTTSFSASSGTFTMTVAPTPTWAGSGAELTPLLPGNYSSSNPATPAGDTIASVFGSYFQDNNPAVSVGVAIVSSTGLKSGTWQYLAANGAAWTNFPAVSATSTLLLSTTDKIRFVPAANFTGTVSLQARAWDGTAGADGTVVNPAKLSSSAFSTTTLTATASVNHAPTLSAATLPPISVPQYATSSPIAVSSLLAQAGFSDPDGAGLPQGVALIGSSWNQGAGQYLLAGGTWQPLPSLAPSSAFLLPSTASLRFVAGSQTGSASLTFAGWDQTQGVAGQPFDITTTGGASAFSTAQATLPIMITQTSNHAPVLTVASATEAPVAVNSTGAPIAVAALLAQAGYVDPDGAGLLQGIALTGAFAAGGTVQYLLPGGTWQPLPAVSSTSALLLPASASVRLVAGSQLGMATLTFAGWDQTQGTSGQLFNLVTVGGATAFSAAVTTAAIPVGQAPSWNASTGATLTPLLPGAYSTANAASPAGDSIGTVFGSYFVDANPNRPVGVAVAGVTGNGIWQYSQTFGASWQNFTAPSTASAVLLSASDLIRFVPNSTKAGAGTLTAYAWDGTAPAVGGNGADGSMVNLKTIGVGGATPFSASPMVATCAVNTAPSLSTASVTLPAVNENVASSALTANALLAKAGYADPDGKSVPAGIAITADSGAGTWQWLNGATWTALPSVYSNAAFLLPGTAQVRFQPANNLAANSYGSASLTYSAWDETAGVPYQAYSIMSTGGASAFSAAQATAVMNVNFVKQAPTWRPGVTASFTPVAGLSTSNPAPVNPGDTVAAVFGNAFEDSAGAPVAVAIAGQTGTSVGAWQYSTDGGATWQAFPATLSTSAALLLSASDKIRFVPTKSFSGAVTLTAYAWDGSGSFTSNIANLTKAGLGGAGPFSATALTATCLVNTAPTLS